MRDGTKHFFAIVCASIFVFPWFSALAQERTRIAWAALNPAASPMWVVQEKGLLRKLGVDAEIIGINSSPIAMCRGSISNLLLARSWVCVGHTSFADCFALSVSVAES